MATVEELVINLIAQVDEAEQRLSSVEQKLEGIGQANQSAQQEFSKTADAANKAGTAADKSGEQIDKAGKSAQKAGDGYKKAGQEAKKAGQEFERAGAKGVRSANLLDKTQARLKKTWTKAAIGYLGGFLMAGAVISQLKDIVSSTLESAGAIGKISEVAGVSRKEVHALGKAFEDLGQDQKSAYGFLKQWNDAQAEADVGRVSKVEQAAKTVGIQTREKDGQLRKGSDVLVEMGQKAVSDSAGDKELAAKRLQALGIEEQAAKAAVNATKELIAEKERDNSVTEEQLAKAEEVSKKFSKLGRGAEDFKEALGYALLPIIDGVLDGIQNIVDFCKELNSAFEEASGGSSLFQAALEILQAPIQIVTEFVDLLFGSLGNLSTWAQTGGQIVYGFFTVMQNVWNTVIGVINGMIASIEGLINALDQLGVALDNLVGGNAVHKEIKLGRISEVNIGKGGGGGAKAPPAWNARAGRGRVRGGYGFGGGSGGGRSGGGGRRSGGRRGGGGGRSGAAGKEEPTYRSTFQGTADPKKLGITPAVAKIPEDPVKKAAQEAKKGGSKQSSGSTEKAVQKPVNQPQTPQKQEAVPVIVKNQELRVRNVGQSIRRREQQQAQQKFESKQDIKVNVHQPKQPDIVLPKSEVPKPPQVNVPKPVVIENKGDKPVIHIEPAKPVEKQKVPRTTNKVETKQAVRQNVERKPDSPKVTVNVPKYEKPAQAKRQSIPLPKTETKAKEQKQPVINIPKQKDVRQEKVVLPKAEKQADTLQMPKAPEAPKVEPSVDIKVPEPTVIQQPSPKFDFPKPEKPISFTGILDATMRPILNAVQSIKPQNIPFKMPPIHAGARQAAGNVTNIHINNSITVNAQGNTNAKQIADRTSNAVNMLSRRQAGAMAA